MDDVFSLILIVFSFLYFVLIIVFTWGWNKNSLTGQKNSNDRKYVSIIVAARNEEQNLPALIKSILSQNYPKQFFEIIICDDASEDNTLNVAMSFSVANENIRIIGTPENSNKGKKHALRRGFREARGEILITTDADCIVQANWLQSIIDGFAANCKPVLLIGPVNIDWRDKKIFSRLQALEFISLQGSTGGASNIGLPIMCNGANLAITKKAWQDAEKHITGDRYSSGDDIFLLHAIKILYPGRIIFLKDQKSIVTTKPSNNLREFLSQRMRWAEKSTGYTDLFTLFTGAIVGGYNVLLSFWLAAGLINASPFTGFAFIIIKMIIDLPLLLQTSKFFNAKKLMFLYPFLSVIYPFYVTSTLTSSIFLPGKWKNRSTKHRSRN
jgi:cellulose synthase/poly-beta-1,6-N-acetylglucosamine synthase-like glycosyltransferase